MMGSMETEASSKHRRDKLKQRRETLIAKGINPRGLKFMRLLYLG